MSAAEAPLQPPVRPVVVLASFRAAPRFVAGGRASVRLRAATGGSVDAPCSGRVTFTGRVAGGPLVLTIACRGSATGLRVTLGGLSAAAGVAQGARVGRGAAVGRLATSQLGLSVRRAGAYVDPVPLLRDATSLPPVAPLPRARAPRWRPPTVRLDRHVEVLEPTLGAARATAPAGPDPMLGLAGAALGGIAAAAAVYRRRVLLRRHQPAVRREHSAAAPQR
ncbi:MAG: hypothetical protein PGN13_04220 [Patulibacter minatonensis]